MRKVDLLKVEKPARYMGQEMGAVSKPAAEFRFVLAFPDVYEVGMSHLGLKVLYSVLNNKSWIAAERVFAPWPDMESLLRSGSVPLVSLETGTPLASADIVGFTLQYELSYTNILNMLDLSGIPLLASDRGQTDPLVIGGGPCTANPEPLADFFDAFVLGDGEEVVSELAVLVRDARREGVARREILARLAGIDGVYVPSLFTVDYAADGTISGIQPLRQGYDRVRRRFLADLEHAEVPTEPVIPFMKAVHDRVSLEIARGCSRGCRFCQAGYIYRPVRERSPGKIIECAAESLRNSGYEELSLLSLSAGDYSKIEPLIKSLMTRYVDDRIAISLPSMRVGTLTPELVDEIRKVRKTGFTLAPEAGSERLRLSINKGVTEEELLENAYSAYAAGWRLIKLYFMTGLPGETDEDLREIVSLSRKVKAQARRTGHGGEVNVSVSNFVPKAHTPFQWERQISEAEIITRQRLLREELRKGKLNFKWHDSRLSSLEGVFARGDRRLGKLLLAAHRLGCRFDGWGEKFDALKWQQAFDECHIDPTWYHRRRDPAEILPWGHLDFGITREFLLRERERSAQHLYTEDCRGGVCTGCGVCDFEHVRMRVLGDGAGNALPDAPSANSSLVQPEIFRKIRIGFSKLADMRYLSHLEMLNLFTRAVSRAGIPVRFSQGFHPHPRFSFATALSVGVESYCEQMDIDVVGLIDASEVMDALNRVLPAGIRILAATEIPLNSPSLSVIIDAVRYRITFEGLPEHELEAMASVFMARDSFIVRREKKGRISEFDLRAEIRGLKVEGLALDMVIKRGKPIEFAAAITGLPAERLAGCRIEKLELIYSEQINNRSDR